ncbi:MAG: toll/interleukin-1 receptor domain-containing protein [Syntrophobacterales bacterium]|jgi:hypothetical protein|nr:toll/interleukin-1 receptor domain-containing protein [Syntrophobacterales bacterium]
MDAKKYFISYTGRDKAWATWIAGVLEERDQTVLIKEWDMRPGDNFITKMDEFLQKFDVFIAVLSEAYLKSPYCIEEWTNAFGIATKEKDKKRAIIPVRVTDVKPDGLLYGLVYIDLCDIHNEKKAEQELLSGIGLEEVSREKPSFPLNPPANLQALLPGNLPQNNLPERNPYFSGRDYELNEIHKQFKSCVTAKQIITGLGGVGKTEIAKEYAHRSINDYKDAIWQVHAETEMTAFNDCLQFADTFGLIPEGMDEARKLNPKQLGRRLKKWFKEHNSWLFIFDNAEQRKDIEPYILGIPTGHILITTRNNDLMPGKSIEIEPFTSRDAVQFIRTRLDRHQDLIDNDLAALTERLNYLPLPLEQAAAYMKRTRETCSAYLALLNKDGAIKALESSLGRPANYPRPVVEALALSFDKLSESAKQLLSLFAYMSPNGIPLDFFERQREKLPSPLSEDLGDAYKQDEIIAELLKYSLVKRDGNVFYIHRLVQEIRREQIKTHGTDWLYVCMEAAIGEIPTLDDYGRLESRKQFEQIAPHAAAIARYAEKAYIGNTDKEEKTALLYHQLGIGSDKLAQYGQALTWYKKALAICEKVLGKEHPGTATTYNNIAFVYGN